MRYPWYSWLSLFGFMIQFIRGAYGILIRVRPFDISRWIVYVGKVAVLLIGLVIIPAAILLRLMSYATSINKTLGTVVNGIILIYVYIAGVLITRMLYRWSYTDGEM